MKPIRLTTDQIEQYHDQGYVLVSGLFTDAQLDELEREADDVIERRLNARMKLNATWGGKQWRERYGTTDTVVLVTHDMHAYSAAWSRALVHDPLTASFADLLGTPNVQLHHSKLFQKPPENGSGFPMHQDYPYFPHAQHSMMAGIIHLTDATEDMGCVCVYPGSHKLGPLDTWEGRHLNPDEYPIEGATQCPAQRGDVLFFNYLTIHGSGLNTSDRTRKTVLIQVRNPLDKPTKDTHRSHAQGMMLRGVHPLTECGAADGALDSPVNDAVPATETA